MRYLKYFGIIGLGLMAGVGVMAFARTHGSAQALLAGPVAVPAATSSPEEFATPMKLEIPLIGVNAPIEALGVTSSGAMEATHNYTDVAWYKYGPFPGDNGSAVIAGHLDTKLTPYAVFYDLKKLKAGDEVDVVEADGKTVRFTVDDLKIYPYDAPTSDVFAAADNSRLNLITCAGTWMPAKKLYDERLVVFTHRSE